MNPFFIVGVQRSGSTLLRLILNAHSKIAIPEEARFLTPFLKRKYIDYEFKGTELKSIIHYFSNVPHLRTWNYDISLFIDELKKRKKITLKEIIELLYDSYRRYEKKEFWGDKSLFFAWIDILSKLFPEAKFIHIIRDGRDVFDSQRRMNPKRNNVAISAIEWSYKIYCIEKQFNRLPKENCMTIKYEDLLTSPEDQIKKVCNFIGVPFESSMLEFYKISPFYIGEHHSKLIFKPIDSSNCFKWKKSLTKSEINIFTFLARKTLKKYNYDVNYALSFKEANAIPFLLLKGFFKRAIEILKIRFILNEAIKKGENFEKEKWDYLPVGKPPKRKGS